MKRLTGKCLPLNSKSHFMWLIINVTIMFHRCSDSCTSLGIMTSHLPWNFSLCDSWIVLRDTLQVEVAPGHEGHAMTDGENQWFMS